MTMRNKIYTFLGLLLLLSAGNVYAAVDPATAWFDHETFEGYTASSTDMKSTFGISSSWPCVVTTHTSTTANVDNNILGFSRSNAVPFTPNGNSSKWTKTFATPYSGRYFYLSTSFFHCTDGTTYQLKNTSGEVVFEFGGINNTKNQAVWATGAARTDVSMGNRAQWSEIEVLIDLETKKLVKGHLSNGAKSYTYADVDLSFGGDVKTLDISTGGYAGAGFDFITLGEMRADGLANMGTNQAEHQTLDASSVQTTVSLETFSEVFGDSVLLSHKNEDIQWTISDWGGLSADDQLLVSLERSSDTRNAVLTTNDAISSDATIQITATMADTSLTTTLELKAVSIAGLKSSLSGKIDASTLLKESVTDSNSYLNAIKSSMQNRIQSAQSVYDTSDATVAQVSEQILLLQLEDSVFTQKVTPYNLFLEDIIIVQGVYDAEDRTYAFHVACKDTLMQAIDQAQQARMSISDSSSLANAHALLLAARTGFESALPIYDALSSTIVETQNRMEFIQPRVGDQVFLQYPTQSFTSLSRAKSTADSILSFATSTFSMDAERADLQQALDAFNAAQRNQPDALVYYHIYSYGADGGDGGANKWILFADTAGTLRYTAATNEALSSTNTKWKITEVSTGRYTFENRATGTFLNAHTLSDTPMNYQLTEARSQYGLHTGLNDSYNLYFLVHSNNRISEIDGCDSITGIGDLTTYTGRADRYRFAFQFEPVRIFTGNGNWSNEENWLNGRMPVDTLEICVESGEMLLDVNKTVRNLQVGAVASMRIPVDKSISIQGQMYGKGNVHVQGALTLSDKAHSMGDVYVQPNANITLPTNGRLDASFMELSSEMSGAATFVNAGTATINRVSVLQPVTGERFWYMTPTVQGVQSGVITSVAGNRLWSYDEAGGVSENEVYTEISNGTTDLIPGLGYVALVQNDETLSLSGSVINGSVQIPLKYTNASPKDGFNLIGNPYLAFLDVQSLINNSGLIEQSVWFRSHNSTTAAMVFDTYNASNGESVCPSGNGSLTGKVAPMQAFWLRSTEVDTLTLHPSLQSHQPSGPYLRSASTTEQRAKVRLEIDRDGWKDETLIAFMSEASSGFEKCDSRKQFNSIKELPEIYTLANGVKLAINSNHSVETTREMPLGVRVGMPGRYVLRVKELTIQSTPVFLLDNQTGEVCNLSAGETYEFETDAALNTENQFVLYFGDVPTGLLKEETPTFFVTSKADGHLTLHNSAQDFLATYQIFSAVGQLLERIESNQSVVQSSAAYPSGMYLVKRQMNGRSETRKIIIR